MSPENQPNNDLPTNGSSEDRLERKHTSFKSRNVTTAYRAAFKEACGEVDALTEKLKGERELDYTAIDNLSKAIAELKKDSVHRSQILLAVNRSCSCGGRPAGTPSTCPACEVWHRLFGDSIAARSGDEKGRA